MSTQYSEPKMVVVKFSEEAQARIENEALLTADASLSAGLEHLLATHADVSIAPLFSEPAANVSPEAASAASGTDIPNLSLYFRIDVDSAGAEQLVEELRRLPGVALAYIEPDYDLASKAPDTLQPGMVLTAACPPGPVNLCLPGPTFLCPPAPFVCPPAPIVFTPDLSGQQTYLEPANAGGMDARFAWTKTGGKGLNMRFADVEFGWDVNHEDLNTSSGTPVFGKNTFEDHGTAVLGEVLGKHDGCGIDGIAPDAQVAVLCSADDKSLADCINHAATKLSAGDVILIELQVAFLPVEIVPAVYDAIVVAVAKGVIVVEAAANGVYDLDNLHQAPEVVQFLGKLKQDVNALRRSVRDSGAIMVGAACPPNGAYGPHRSRWLYSNFGSRLDVQGQGRLVCTSGYGDLFDAGPHRKYTADFVNTSAAAPQIVGAVLCIQGIRKAKGDPVLAPKAMRDLLVKTGSPQVSGNYGPAAQHIGPQPDLLKAYKELYPSVVLVCPTPVVLQCPPAPIACPPAPSDPPCPPAPFVLCQPAPTVPCPPAAFVFDCPPAPDVFGCPIAPVLEGCPPGPIEFDKCPPGPAFGWPEKIDDWKDFIIVRGYIKDVGHALILVRKDQVRTTQTAEVAEAATYGYDQVYWNYNTADLEAMGQASAGKEQAEAMAQAAEEFKPVAKKREK